MGTVCAKFQKNGIEILQCRVCGLAFWIPDASYEPEKLYGANYFGDAETEGDDESGVGYDDYSSLEPALRANFAKRLRGAR